MSMKNSNDTIGNRSCDLPPCSAVPQPTAPPRAPNLLTKAAIIVGRSLYATVFGFNQRWIYLMVFSKTQQLKILRKSIQQQSTYSMRTARRTDRHNGVNIPFLQLWVGPSILLFYI
jgi:hypothetical protein